MALGMDPRLDLTKTYFVLAGIAGIDPAVGSVGSGVWASWVVEATLGHFIDPREMPDHWTWGHWPSARGAHGGRSTEAVPYPLDMPSVPGVTDASPYDRSAAAATIQSSHGGMYAVELHPGLVRWAFELTQDITLPDSERLQLVRAKYTDFPNALRPPFVLMGDNLDGQTYWAGTLQTEWAREWVHWHTGGAGRFATSAMEDTGVLKSLLRLGTAERVDARRVLVLRTASDYTMPHANMSAAQGYFNPCPECSVSATAHFHCQGA